MDGQNFNKLLNTLSITLEVAQASTTTWDEHAGPITQSIWTERELAQIKGQLKGLLKIIPTPDYFTTPSDNGQGDN